MYIVYVYFICSKAEKKPMFPLTLHTLIFRAFPKVFISIFDKHCWSHILAVYNLGNKKLKVLLTYLPYFYNNVSWSTYFFGLILNFFIQISNSF